MDDKLNYMNSMMVDDASDQSIETFSSSQVLTL